MAFDGGDFGDAKDGSVSDTAAGASARASEGTSYDSGQDSRDAVLSQFAPSFQDRLGQAQKGVAIAGDVLSIATGNPFAVVSGGLSLLSKAANSGFSFSTGNGGSVSYGNVGNGLGFDRSVNDNGGDYRVSFGTPLPVQAVTQKTAESVALSSSGALSADIVAAQKQALENALNDATASANIGGGAAVKETAGFPWGLVIAGLSAYYLGA